MTNVEMEKAEMSVVKRQEDEKKAKAAEARAASKTGSTAPATAETKATETPAPAASRKPSKIGPVKEVILPLMKAAVTVKSMAEAASKQLKTPVSEREVRSAIDSARRGTNDSPGINIQRVAPLTFKIMPRSGKAA